jgi:uncharacterized repeat protein (TIGR01451 family)
MPPARPLPPAPAPSEPAALASPPAELPAPTLDPEVERTQAAGLPPASGQGRAASPTSAPAATAPPLTPVEGRPIPAAALAQGQAPVAEPEPTFVIPPEKLPVGRQGVGLTVDVLAPAAMNLNQTYPLKVVVRNSGTTDAHGVVVRDELPEGLEFESSQPEAKRIDSLLSWSLGTVPAGTEQVLVLNVKPVKVGPFEHAATVTLVAGSKSRTVVRQPKLKVEQVVPSGKILRGQSVQFQITVSNPGDGPARNVIVQAKLSPGLKHESGEPNDQNIFEQTIDEIGPGQRVQLDTLVAETVLGDEQSCTVVAKSPDVSPPSPEAMSTKTITVVEPKLKLSVAGPAERYTDTSATYEITLDNPGTAPARNVRAQAIVPTSARLVALPLGARYDPATRRLSWARPQLNPGEKAVFAFQVRLGGIGFYEVVAEARADGTLFDKGMARTDVKGLADVTFDVSERRRVIDVGGKTVFVIKVVNSGTKDATGLLVSATLSEAIKPGQTYGTDQGARYSKAENKVVFPKIERLGHGKSLELGIEVEAIKNGLGVCRVSLTHDELSEKLDDVAAFKITATRR